MWAGPGDSSLFHVAPSEGWLAQRGLGHIVGGLGSHCGLSSCVLLVASPGGELSTLTAARWPQYTQTSHLGAGFPQSTRTLTHTDAHKLPGLLKA